MLWSIANLSMLGKPNQMSNPAPLKPIPAIEEWFSKVLVDCVGPLPKSRSGNQYLLTMINTMFPEAIPMQNIKAATIVKALFLRSLAFQDTFKLTKGRISCLVFSNKACTNWALLNANHLLTILNLRVQLNTSIRLWRLWCEHAV